MAAPDTTSCMCAVITEKKAFDTALSHLTEDACTGLLEVELSRAPNIVFEETDCKQYPHLNNAMLEDSSYQQSITDLHDGDLRSWKGVPPSQNSGKVGCVCGQTFDTTFGLDLHVHSTRVGSHYNIAPEARPRLSAVI